MSPETLNKILGCGMTKATKFAEPLTAAMTLYGIETPIQQAAFIAQIGHESGRLQYIKELGSDKYLDKYDTGELAKRLGNTPQDDDDGQKYCGRGLIQTTGRANYAAVGKELNIDLLNKPELLEQPTYAALSAAFFWKSKNLNAIASDVKAVTKKVNGGFNGLAERTELFEKAKKILCA